MDFIREFYLLALIFLLLTGYANILATNFPKLPGDIFIDKPNLKLYIPFTSSIIISVLLTLLLNWFSK